MTTETPHTESSRHRQPCARDGCNQTIKRGSRYATCSMLCDQVCRALEAAERVAKATDGPAAAEHWLTAVALNDAVTAYYDSDRRIYFAAREVGITRKQWEAIKSPRGGALAPGA